MTLLNISGRAAVDIKQVAGLVKAYDDSSPGVVFHEGRYFLGIQLIIPAGNNVMYVRFVTENARDNAYDKAVEDLEARADY